MNNLQLNTLCIQNFATFEDQTIDIFNYVKSICLIPSNPKGLIEAAKELLSRRIAGTKAPRLSERYRPTSLDDALAIQAAMVDLHRSKVGGWKCLLPLSEEKLIVAPIFEDSVQFGSECEAFSDNGVVRIEPEIAFVPDLSG